MTPLLFGLLLATQTPAIPADFTAQCWEVVGPVEGKPSLVDRNEWARGVSQPGTGLLTRRQVYAALEDNEAAAAVTAREDDLLWRARLWGQLVPLAVGGAAVGLVPVLAAAGILGAVYWLAPTPAPVAALLAGSQLVPWLTFLSVVAVLVALPLAFLVGAAASVPIIVGIFRTVQLGQVSPGFLLEGVGFPEAEAIRVANAHNDAVARSLGLSTTPVCARR